MLEYKGYVGQAEFEAEAGIFHGEILNIGDVVTFQGETMEQLLTAFHDSVDDYLAFCKKRSEEAENGRGECITHPQIYKRWGELSACYH